MHPALSLLLTHAIVLAMMERGPVYVEPQTGRELAITPV